MTDDEIERKRRNEYLRKWSARNRDKKNEYQRKWLSAPGVKERVRAYNTNYKKKRRETP